MHEWGNLEIRQDRGGLVEAKGCGVVALEIQRDGVTNIVLQLLERPGLGNDRRVNALGGVAVIRPAILDAKHGAGDSPFSQLNQYADRL
jgi:hypothetical protein